MGLLQKIREWAGIGMAQIEDEPIDVLNSISDKHAFLQDQLKKAQTEFDEISQTLELKIAACNKLIEKGEGAQAEFNKKVLGEKLDKITDEYLEESSSLVEQINEERERKVELESSIISKSVELVALLSEEEQEQIKHTLGVWELTGLIKGEEIDDQTKAIVKAVDLVIKGEEEIQKSVLVGDITKEVDNSNEEFVEDLVGHYANSIIKDYTKEGCKILFIKRSPTDEIEPSKWGLPGGKIEEGETIKQAAERETKEEVNLDVRCNYIRAKAKCNDGKWAFYLDAYPDDKSILALLDGENINAAWMTEEEWLNSELIFDLKDHLVAMEIPNEISIDELPTIEDGELKKSEDSELEKSQFIGGFGKKEGEGSKGGRVIGHTKSGKPVYARLAARHYQGFKKQDHLDAAEAHGKVESGSKGEAHDYGKSGSTSQYWHKKKREEHEHEAGKEEIKKAEDLEKGGIGSGKYIHKKNKPFETNEHGVSFYDLSNLSPEETEIEVSKPHEVYRDASRGGGKMFDELTISSKKKETIPKFEMLGAVSVASVKINDTTDGGYHVAIDNNGVNVKKWESALALAKTIIAIKEKNKNARFTTHINDGDKVWKLEKAEDSDIKKKSEDFELEKGGRVGQQGETRKWGNREYKKEGKKWHEIVNGKPKPLPTKEVVSHAENTSTPQLRKIATSDHHLSDAAKREIERRKSAAIDKKLKEESGARQAGQGQEEPKAKKRKVKHIKYEPNPHLEPHERVKEKEFAKHLNKNFERSLGQYEAMFGNVLNTDNARELSEFYRSDRGQSATIHEPASALIRKMYDMMLKEPVPKGKRNMVLFSAGGTGAGKTSGIKEHTQTKAAADRSHIVYDTNMNTFGGSKEKIDKALAAGKKVNIVYTFREPLEAFTEGAVPRAQRMESKLGSGRTVPIGTHVATHLGSLETIKKLKEHYKDNKKVAITVIDNSKGKGKSEIVPIGNLQEKKYIADDLQKQLEDITDKLHERGEISEKLYRGFKQKGD